MQNGLMAKDYAAFYQSLLHRFMTFAVQMDQNIEK